MTNLPQESGIFRAGVAQVDITPQAGIQLAGAVGHHRPAKLVPEALDAVVHAAADLLKQVFDDTCVR